LEALYDKVKDRIPEIELNTLCLDLAFLFIIFGNDYRQDAAMIMPWLAAAIFVGAFKSYYLDVVFQLRHATKYLGYIAILMAAVNIIMNLLLLPHFGLIAAAWATLAAFTTGALASWAVGKFMFALPALGNVFWGSASASAIMIAVLYLLPSSSGLILFFLPPHFR
jgi:O-antigen/teichoic acid export membrane protein